MYIVFIFFWSYSISIYWTWKKSLSWTWSVLKKYINYKTNICSLIKITNIVKFGIKLIHSFYTWECLEIIWTARPVESYILSYKCTGIWLIIFLFIIYLSFIYFIYLFYLIIWTGIDPLPKSVLQKKIYAPRE